MRLTGRWGSLLLTLNILALAVVFFYTTKELAVPIVAEWFYKEEYKELVFKCDSVMREHFIAKNQVLHSPSE